MNFVHHAQCNATLTSEEEGVKSLPVTRGKMGEVEVVRSYWRPTKEELKQLNKLGCVAMTMVGTTHAPVRLDVVPMQYAPIDTTNTSR